MAKIAKVKEGMTMTPAAMTVLTTCITMCVNERGGNRLFLEQHLNKGLHIRQLSKEARKNYKIQE